MQFDVISLFPQLLSAFREVGVLGKAVESGTVRLLVHDLRDWAGNRWRQVDDEPYGGGAGMVIQVPPTVNAVRDVMASGPEPGRLILLSPRGRPFTQQVAEDLVQSPRLVFLCGRYEGFDERIVEILEPEELSLGDFILGGGEVAAMAVIEAVARLVPGVVGDPESVVEDSFSNGLLDYPCYTRPPEVEGLGVPDVLLSGNHAAIRRWRLEQAVQSTVERRPDLVAANWSGLSAELKELVRRLAPGLAAELDAVERRNGSAQ